MAPIDDKVNASCAESVQVPSTGHPDTCVFRPTADRDPARHRWKPATNAAGSPSRSLSLRRTCCILTDTARIKGAPVGSCSAEKRLESQDQYRYSGIRPAFRRRALDVFHSVLGTHEFTVQISDVIAHAINGVILPTRLHTFT